MNFPGAWMTPLKVMPPLAYARFPKTVKRKLEERPMKVRPADTAAFKLADLLPARRRSASSAYNDESTKQENRESSPWPALTITRKSTEIFGRIPAEDRSQINEIANTLVSPDVGYFLEKSEIEISPRENIFREKRYSVETFFGRLSSRNDFSPRGAPRFHREIRKKSAHRDNGEFHGLAREENASRLLAILAGNHGGESSTKRNRGGRAKRQTREDETTEKIDDREVGGSEKDVSDGSGPHKNGRRKPQYTPVFKECNDTAASEISDLNAPPPPLERRATLQTYARNSGQYSDDIDFQLKKNAAVSNREVNNEPQTRGPQAPVATDEEEVVEARPKETATSLRNSQNATYINLQDHQKGTLDGNTPKDSNGYPVDIAPYNPDVIPYVDVPDYSDQREESLDKDDRRVAKERYVEYPDDDADVIDPGVPLNSDKKSERIIVRDDDVSGDDEVPKGHVESKSRGAEGVRGEEVKEENSKQEEDEHEEERETSRLSSDNENVEEEEDGEKEQEEDANSKDVRNSDIADDAKDFEPVHFDIEEYKKPFNLDELFKDIEKEAQQAQKNNKTTEKDVNEHQGSKNIPVREDSDGVVGDLTGEYHGGEDFEFPTFETAQAQEKKRNEGNWDASNGKNSHEEATLAPPNFFEEFEKVFGPAISETPFKVGYFETENEREASSPPESPAAVLVDNEDDKYPYGSPDTYERLFGGTDEADKAEDGDTYREQHSDADDASAFHSKKQAPDTDALQEPAADELLREPYKTLATILDKKDDISRLDDEVAEKAKKEGKMPPKYHNYWTLEYGSPAKEEKT